MPIVNSLVARSADVNARDGSHKSVLEYACSQMRDLPNVVTALIDAGADINAVRGGWNDGALHMAATQGHVHTLQVLLNAGVDVNTRDMFHVTPLHLAAYNQNHPRSMRVLLEARADVNARTLGGKLPVDFVRSSRPKLKLCIRHGAVVSHLDDHFGTLTDLIRDAKTIRRRALWAKLRKHRLAHDCVFYWIGVVTEAGCAEGGRMRALDRDAFEAEFIDPT